MDKRHSYNWDKDFEKHCELFESYLNNSKNAFRQKFEKDDMAFLARLEDFTIIKHLGSGGFGQVVLAQKSTVPDKGNFFAMKLMEKEKIVKMKQVEHCIQEVRIMDAVDFPFLVYLLYYLKHNCYILLVMPFLAGGDLFSVMEKLGKLDEALAKFYAAQVLLAFEYLHYHGVVYRDLKPENVLLDSNGYLKITDFGFCKKIDDERTWTLCGTPDYLAPELILSQGYNRSVDYWTFGILLFEMDAGCPPFEAPDPMKLYSKIVAGKYSMPKYFSKNLQHLISNILQVDRDKRFGLLRNGMRDIKGHPWFKEIDFETIFHQKAPAPYRPSVQPPDANIRAKDIIIMKKCETDKYAAQFSQMTIRKKNRTAASESQ